MPEVCRLAFMACGGLGLLLFLGFVFLPKRAKSTLLSLSLCLLFAAGGLFNISQGVLAPRQALAHYLEKEMPVTLTVLEVRYQYNYGSSYLVQIDRLGEQEITAKAILNFEFDPDFRENDILEGEALIHDIDSYPGNTTYYLSEGIGLYLVSETEESTPALFLVGQKEADLWDKVKQINRSLSDILTASVKGEEGDLISSLLLGNKELLSKSVMRDFKRAGIVHVLSISGMHLALMIALSEFLMQKLRIHKTVRAVIVLFVAFFYLALTGFALSTVRAFIMAAFVYLSYLFRSDNDSITSLFVALFLILLLFPEAIYDVGLWLSFSATFGILIAIELLKPVSDLLYKKLQNKNFFKPLNNAMSGIVISFAASFCTFLPAWLFFDEISLLSIPATLLLSPPATLILYLAPFYLLLSKTSFLGSALAFWLRIICRTLLESTALFSLFSGATVSLHYPFERILIPAAAVILVSLLLLPLRKKILIPTAALCATIAFFICLGAHQYQNQNAMTAEYLRHGSSEMLLLTDADKTVLCDISSGGYSVTYDALTRSKSYYATEIDAYILTHYHKLHIGSVNRLSEQTLVRKLYLPYPKTQEEYYTMLSLFEVAHRCGIPVTVYDRGEKLPLENDLSLFISEEIYLGRSTHPTFYVAAQKEDKLLLYLAESAHESEQLAAQLTSLIPRADALILGTHGPITKAPLPFDLSETPSLFIADTDVLLWLNPPEMPNGKWVVGSRRVTVKMK